jgi:hypothetical protein
MRLSLVTKPVCVKELLPATGRRGDRSYDGEIRLFATWVFFIAESTFF